MQRIHFKANVGTRTFYKRPNTRVVKAYSTLGDVLIAQSELIGKGLTLFVFFTTSLNYLYYRNLRKQFEEENLKHKDNIGQRKNNEKDTNDL